MTEYAHVFYRLISFIGLLGNYIIININIINTHNYNIILCFLNKD